MRTWIERVAVDKFFNRRIDEWKTLRVQGWELTVLITLPARTEAICFGYLADNPPQTADLSETPSDKPGNLTLF